MRYQPDPLDPDIIHEVDIFYNEDNEPEVRIDGEVTLSFEDAHNALAPPNHHDLDNCTFCDFADPEPN